MKTFKEERPWGNFERFCQNEKATVKILHVNPHEAFSLQFHHNRDEFWKVIEGTGNILIGNETRTGKKGDEFFIPSETKHQIKTSDASLSIMEISFGDFDENDIVRLEDKYKRNNTSPEKTILERKPAIPPGSLLVGKSVIKNKTLMFYYLPDSACLSVFLIDKLSPGLHQNYFPLWKSSVKIKPLKIKRSKDVIRFYFSRGKITTSVKFSLAAILIELYLQNQSAEHYPEDKKLVLARAINNPILSASSENRWESSAVFNTGAVLLNDKVHFIYRAIGESGLSVFGYASSKDGIHIDERLTTPAFVCGKLLPEKEPGFAPYPYLSGGSWWGSEDPRLTVIGETLYMTYTAFDGVHPPCVAMTSIEVNDFLNKQWNWVKPKMISEPGKINKNWVVFPEKINGKFAILHSLTPEISIDYRETLDFKNADFIKSTYHSNGREKYWDNWMRGVGGPPVKTEKGWLVLYHAMDKRDPDKYKLGAMILDSTHPEKILFRSDHPVLEPDAWYENNGHKKGVVYNCGSVLMDEKLLVYYGGSDTCTCAASVDIAALLADLSTPENSKMQFPVSLSEK